MKAKQIVIRKKKQKNKLKGEILFDLSQSIEVETPILNSATSQVVQYFVPTSVNLSGHEMNPVTVRWTP